MMDAEEFFYDHAGWAYDPKTETAEDGRRRGARELTRAEQWAREVGIDFWWEGDWDLPPGGHMEFWGADQEPTTCEVCTARGPGDGQVYASLGCVDDATPEYRRVIEAELALEAMDGVRRETFGPWLASEGAGL